MAEIIDLFNRDDSVVKRAETNLVRTRQFINEVRTLPFGEPIALAIESFIEQLGLAAGAVAFYYRIQPSKDATDKPVVVFCIYSDLARVLNGEKEKPQLLFQLQSYQRDQSKPFAYKADQFNSSESHATWLDRMGITTGAGAWVGNFLRGMVEGEVTRANFISFRNKSRIYHADYESEPNTFFFRYFAAGLLKDQEIIQHYLNQK